MTRMSRCTRSERRVSAHRHRIGSQYPAGAPRVLVIVCALLLASLAAVISTVPTANADTPADPSTTGTASTVSPSTDAGRRGDDHVHALGVPRRCDGSGSH